MFEIPDLLRLQPRRGVDQQAVEELLELAYLGREIGPRLDRALGLPGDAPLNGWSRDLFERDLFLPELIRDVVQVEVDGERRPLHARHLLRVLTDPPTDEATIEFRQAIMRELLEDPKRRTALESLYVELDRLLTLFRVPGQTLRLDDNEHRLETFRQAAQVVETMRTSFATSSSGLRRLHDAGKTLEATREFETLRAVLDHDSRYCRIDAQIALSPDGHVRRLEIRTITENERNPFYRPPLRRLLDRLRLAVWHGTWPSNREIANRLVRQVFDQISPALTTLVEITAQIEVYLFGLALVDRSREAGLSASIPEFGKGWEIQGLFNPLLLVQGPPTAIDVGRGRDAETSFLGTTLITGPNSGGKTRLLQSIGLCQLLGQSGLPVPAASATLPRVEGLFVSLIETEAFDEGEGRLGREMVRIRRLFEGLRRPALVLLDELCSGTNPSEGNELFSMVLRLLDRLGAVAFVSTHFLDYARELEHDPPVGGMEFLQVEIDAQQRSTYRFVPGVATTSLASVTAARLGVTFETLAELIDDRLPPRQPALRTDSDPTPRPRAEKEGAALQGDRVRRV